ncbi:MAG TPA: hypothetical protein VHE14_00960 [Solirubrobacteraceae bacterium]|nr:hypothetical protein [Solirubrobacteraceae bacterium]
MNSLIHRRRGAVTPCLIAVTIAALLGVLTLAHPAVSEANTYKVYACALPDGTPVQSDGWSQVAVGAGGGFSQPCTAAANHYMGVTLTPPYTLRGTSSAAWEFNDTAANTDLRAVNVSRASDVLYKNVGYTVTASDAAGSTILNSCHPSAVGQTTYCGSGWTTEPYTTSGATTKFNYSLDCTAYADGDCQSSAVSPAQTWGLRLQQAIVTIGDNNSPHYTSTPSGSLLSGGTVRGIAGYSYAATDQGSGLYRSLTYIDGNVADMSYFDPASGSCRNVNPTSADPYQFTSVQPCRLSGSSSVSIDTAKIPDGTHQVSVAVEDAAGNRQLYGPVAVATANGTSGGNGQSTLLDRGERNGSGTDDHGTLTAVFDNNKRTITVPYGRQTTITGHLADATGNPISGAKLNVNTTTQLAGAASADLGATVTDAAGNWTYTAPVGPSREIVVGWHAYSKDLDYSATDSVTLLVTAAARISVKPKRLRNGRKAKITGWLLGDPFPQSGVLVTVQGRAKVRHGHWQTFATMSSDRSGSFRTRHRFRTVTRGNATFLFRALIKKQDAYPYEAGYSNTVKTRVRGH